ncbi:MAG TPA: MOSC N-terminal beta barrel domain-containing protein [Nitrososphaeraceae archaeon]|nr:MOSC N-terminal beta barrel domain-containing protein [Nitrososphaeraceae archaeon]
MDKSQTTTGTVVSVWRYPVKSMLGEELNASYVTERGLVGDRAYALLDEETGKVASAKNPRKWEKLFDFRSVFIDPPQVAENIPHIRITLPDGTQVFSSQDKDIDYTLSKALGRDVRLMKANLDKPSYEEYWPDIEGLAQREKVTDEAMPPRTFFDIAVIHLLTTSTINRLRGLYPEGRFEVRRFRPNIVVESASGEKDFIENSWIGKKITIGEDIVLRVMGPCTRCVMITLPQGDLPRDLGILGTVAKYNRVNVGVYASVLRSGTIHRGDLVRLEA